MSFQRDFLSKRITDPLAKKIHDLGQEEYAQNFQVQNIDTLNVQILSIKTKTKTLSKDKFHVSLKSYNPDQRFYNAVYPDRDKLKLWLKGENSDKLHDYSLTNHNVHLWSAYQVAEQYQRDDPNNMAGHEIVSYTNGTHYIHVEDRKDLRISDLIVDEPTNTGFTIITRFHPLIYGTSNQDSKIIEQKIDSSQNRYGHSINVDNKGNVYFYVKYNYRQYFCKLNFIPNIKLLHADYAAANYRDQNYYTETRFLPELYDVMYDLVCKFNYTTKECSIKVLLDGQIIASDSSASGNGINALPPNLQLHLPLQEGKWSEVKTLPNNLPMAQVYDASANQFIGTIINPTLSGQWEDNNTFHNTRTSSGTYISIPNHVNLDAFTEFTVCFWAKYDEVTADGTFRFLMTKGWSANGSLTMYRSTNTNIVVCAFKNDAGVTGVRNLTLTDTNWHFYCMRWKTGEGLKASIDGVETVGPVVTGTVTNSSPLTVYGSATENVTMVNFMLFKRQLTTAEVTQLYQYGSHLAQFPTNLEPQRLINPTPPQQTNPIVTIYDLPRLTSPTINDYTFINNPSSQSPFVAKYSCPDGVASGIPVADLYNIAPGTGSTTTIPVATPYTLPGASSTGQIVADDDEWAYVQYVLINTSVLYNQKFTEIQLWLNGLDAPEGGSIYLGIVKNDGTVIKFGTAIDPATVPDAWTSYTKQLFTNTYPLAVGDGIGVIWEGGTGGTLNVRRGGQNVHYDVDVDDNPRSCQNGRRGAGLGEWKTPNEVWAMAGTLKTGGGSTGTSPYYILKNTTGNFIFMGELFPTGSPIIGQKPTYASFRVYRDTAANNGTVSIRHVKANGTYYPTLYQINVADLPNETAIPTTFNFVWNNVDYANPILAGERIVVVVEGLTTGNVYVLSNVGNSAAGNSYDTTRSYLTVKNFTGTFSGNTGLDVSGVIRKGGSVFVPSIKFSPTITRIYERCVNASSSFYDQPISRVTIRGKRTGIIQYPSVMTCVLKNNANVDKVVIGTFDANSVSAAALEDITFTNNNNSTKVAPGDYICIILPTCTATEFIELNINTNVVDAGNSIMGTVEGGIVTDQASFDLAGKFFTGGQIDNVSRKRVAQYIDTQDSNFLKVPNNRITILDILLTKVGAASGLIYFNIRRGTDDALIFNLGNISAGSITTALTGTLVHVTNFNNTYILAAKDKISIEYEGGDQLNKIGVHVRAVSPSYDGANSYIARYNGVEYDYVTASDLAAKMQVGGDVYQPEANAPPPVLPQNPTDLYILAAPTKRQNSFMKCIFGSYLFFNTLLTDQELINFNVTRIDTGNNLPNEIQVTNHSFFRNS